MGEVKTPFWDTVSSSDATTATTVYTPADGTRFYLTNFVVSTGTAGTITIYDESDTIAILYMAANTTVVLSFKTPIKSGEADNILKVKHSASGNISATASGWTQ